MMSNESVDYFQCLACKVFFPTLWKVERHVKRLHENGESNYGFNGSIRRGMLPIQKVSFRSCYVPVVKNQIDPDFLAQYEQVLPKEEPPDIDYSSFDHFLTSGIDDDDVSVLHEEADDCLPSSVGGRRLRKCRIKAGEKIRQVVLGLSNQSEQTCDEEMDEEYEFLKKVCEDENELGSRSLKRRCNYDDDEDFTLPAGSDRELGWNSGPEQVKRLKRKYNRTAPYSRRPKGPGTSSKVKPKEFKEKCEFCSKLFTVKHCLHNHILKFHLDQAKTVCCPLPSCGHEFLSYFKLRFHLNLHTIAENEEIDQSSPDKETIEKRIKTYKKLSLEKFSCKFCLNRCKSKENLEAHLKAKHNSLTNEFKCPFCEQNSSKAVSTVVEFILHITECHPGSLDPFDERREYYKEKGPKKYLRRFKCSKCDMSFFTDEYLKKHDQKFHGELSVYSCPVCKRGFKQKDNLRRHLTLHMENNPFVCEFPDCGRKFNSDYNLRRHQALHYEILRVKCPLCPKTYSAKDKLTRHLRHSHKPSDITNPNQKKIPAIRMSRFNREMNTNNKFSSKQQNSTSTANSETPDASNEGSDSTLPIIKKEVGTLQVKSEDTEQELHEEVHLTDKILLGSDGSAVHVKGETLNPETRTTRLISLAQVQRIPTSPVNTNSLNASDLLKISTLNISSMITNDPKLKEICQKDPSILTSILTKKTNYHTGKSFKCSECSTVFSRAWTLQLHLEASHKKKIMDQVTKPVEENQVMLMCGTCAYPAKNANDLKKHIKKTHDNGPKFKCLQCGRGFHQNSKMQQHLQEIHYAERKHVCKICKKAYTTEQHLMTHVRKVHEQKKKECPICKRLYCVYSLPEHLKTHQRKITRFKCLLCNDSFATETSRKRHIDCVHLGKPLNKLRYRARQLVESGTVAKRGPKLPSECDWFAPLMDKIGGPSYPRASSNGMSVDKDKGVMEKEVIVDSNVSEHEKAKEEDPSLSILGF